jgi:AcrR family transcriptional regulator
MPAEARRQAILAAAMRVFAAKGYAGAGTSDVAQAAGIGEPTIYRYFANKRELYEAALEETGEHISQSWRRIAAEHPRAIEAIAHLASWYIAELQAHPEAMVLRLRSLAEGDAEAMAGARERYAELERFVGELYARAQEQGDAPEAVSPRAAAWLFMAVGSYFDVNALVRRPTLDQPQLAELFSVLARALWQPNAEGVTG